jgi:hypothetical protein
MNPPEQTPENPPVSNPINSTPGQQERVLAVLAKKVDDLERELYEVKHEKIIKETQLPPEILAQLGITSNPPRRLKRGNGFRPLLAHEITEAKRVLKEKRPEVNEAMVSRYLGVNYFTYKKYARMYGLWEPKPNIKGHSGIYDAERGKHPLSEILVGKYPDYPIFRIKDKLIRSGTKEPKCENCGFKEKRVTDGKVPLILNFMDENSRNHLLDNMKLYCYNCTFTCGRGYIRTGEHYFDPDWLQGAEKDEAEENVRW